MTTRIGRWRRAFNAICAALMCAVLAFFASGSLVSATPFASVIMDVRTGEILQSSNSTARLHPASLTKMMTLYLAFEAVENGEISLETRVRISAHAASQPPSRLGLRAGQRIAFRYLIRAAALRSANDAAVAIAEALEGSVSNFSTRMNRTARAIGMTRTNFNNPHGLTSEGHLSTARDMSRLGRQLYFDFPQYYNIFSRLRENAGIATVRNTNRRFLNGYSGADGIKTGFTNAAGYNLTAMAERRGVRVLVTVMGARSSTHRYQQIVALMDRGFRDAPRRAAVRRPGRPDYSRGPRGSIGRTVRLQTAPTSSLFPLRRPPQPGETPAPEMVATLRDEIDGVIDEILETALATEDNDSSADLVAPATPDAAEIAPPAETGRIDIADASSAAPLTSLIPAQRPDFVTNRSADVARASGTSTGGMTQIAVIEDAGPLVQSPADGRAGTASSLMDSAPLQFEHDSDAIAEVYLQDGMVFIPGLPPIASDLSGQRAPGSFVTAQPNMAIPGAEGLVAGLQDNSAAETELTVGTDGLVLFRDQEILAALQDEDPADPVLAPSIVLTTTSAEDPPAPPPMPEIVTRVSTSGGRVWSVELGLFGSRFDADRALLRLALSEAGTLGTGVRRVTTRDGRYVAEVLSLSQEAAELACTRLNARDHPCTVALP